MDKEIWKPWKGKSIHALLHFELIYAVYTQLLSCPDSLSRLFRLLRGITFLTLKQCFSLVVITTYSLHVIHDKGSSSLYVSLNMFYINRKHAFGHLKTSLKMKNNNKQGKKKTFHPLYNNKATIWRTSPINVTWFCKYILKHAVKHCCDFSQLVAWTIERKGKSSLLPLELWLICH